MSFDIAPFFEFDALVVAGVLAGSLLFTYTIGRYVIVPMVAALGVGGVFAALAPYVGNIPGIDAWAAYQQNIFVFVVVAAVAFFVFRRHAYFEPSVMPSGFERVVCGVMIGGFVLAIIASFLPVDIFTALSPQIRAVFANPLPRTLWVLAPIITFAVMRRR